jgi:two-component system, cell cycle sensor histidine kinase and response regulator CckA
MADPTLRVLLVDDNKDDFELTRRLLAGARFDRFALDWIADYDQALAAIRARQHDAYLIDQNLRTRSGLDLVREARDTPSPIILFTGQGTEALHLEALLAGAADYVDKNQLDSSGLERVIRHAYDRSRVQLQLKSSEERFKVLVENLSDGILTMAKDGTVLYASPSTLGILGFPEDELVGQKMFEFIHPEDRPTTMRIFSECLAKPGLALSSETRYRTRGGAWRHIEALTVNRLDEIAVSAVVATIRDVSSRKETEKSLHQRERQFRALFDSALDAMVLVSDDRAFLDANPAASQLFGMGRERLLTQVVDRFCPPEFPVAERWTEFVMAGEFKGDFTLVLDQRSRRQVELSARAHVLPGRHLLVLRDMTERNELEARLRQGAKMEAVGRLAGGIAHDFNNLLTAILGCCELLAMELKDVPNTWEDLEEIRGAATRAGGLTQQLLAFSRRQVLNPKVLDLNSEVENIRRMLSRVIGEDITLATQLDTDLGQIKADPSQLEQILMNLVINARDAMPDGGTLLIGTANADPPSEWNQPPDRCVMLSVQDTGVGMDDDVRSHIFEPFFTTKEMGKGTGLGLATVYGIVKQSGGYITVESSPGKGATFRVYFPRIQGLADQPKRSPRLSPARTRAATILLVEDELAVRRLASKLLRQQGYTVLEAANGLEALRLASDQKQPIHLLLTDVVMPGMSGPELALHLGQEQPDMKVIYMSGYADEALGNHGILAEGMDFLQKPFTPHDLTVRVRESLHTAG